MREAAAKHWLRGMLEIIGGIVPRQNGRRLLALARARDSMSSSGSSDISINRPPSREAVRRHGGAAKRNEESKCWRMRGWHRKRLCLLFGPRLNACDRQTISISASERCFNTSALQLYASTATAHRRAMRKRGGSALNIE